MAIFQHVKEKADSLEDDRNHWRKQAESVTLLLETDRKKPGIFDLLMFLVVYFWVSKWTWFLDLSCFSGNTLNNSEGSI
jgi:hypothetical protein